MLGFNKILVINTGLGNIGSVLNALKHLGFECLLVSNYFQEDVDINSFKGFILPGVGSFSAGIKSLRSARLDILINKLVEAEVPGIGICLGMQMMVNTSEESEFGEKGLGLFDGKVIKLPNNVEPVPHIGWSKTSSLSTENILYDLMNNDFYYIHSYAVKLDKSSEEIATFEHGGNNYVSAIYKPRLLGVQFHPEKSQEKGLEIFNRFFLNS